MSAIRKDPAGGLDGASAPGLLVRHEKTIHLILNVYFLTTFAVPGWFSFPTQIVFYDSTFPIHINMINISLILTIIFSFFHFRKLYLKIFIIVICTLYTVESWLVQIEFWFFAKKIPNIFVNLDIRLISLQLLSHFCQLLLIIKFFSYIINKINGFINRRRNYVDSYTAGSTLQEDTK